MSDILPCPFCGYEMPQISIRQTTGRHEVFCMSCDSAGRPSDTEAEAIAAWNNRAEPARDAGTAAEVERLTKVIDDIANKSMFSSKEVIVNYAAAALADRSHGR